MIFQGGEQFVPCFPITPKVSGPKSLAENFVIVHVGRIKGRIV